MTGFTTFENFPYPQGADPFKVQPDDTGFPQQSRDLALAAQAKIDAAPSYIKHRPYFKMTMNLQTSFPVSTGVVQANIPFDTINVDTVGTICDLTRSNSGVYLTQGIWVVGSYILIQGIGDTTPFGTVLNSTTISSSSNRIKLGPTQVQPQSFDGGPSNLQSFLNASFIVYCGPQTPVTTSPTVNVASNATQAVAGPTSVSVNYATVWGYWVSDLP